MLTTYQIELKEFGKIKIFRYKNGKSEMCYEAQVLEFDSDNEEWVYSDNESISIGKYSLEYDRVIVSWNIYLNNEEIITIEEGLDDHPVFITISEDENIKF